MKDIKRFLSRFENVRKVHRGKSFDELCVLVQQYEACSKFEDSDFLFLSKNEVLACFGSRFRSFTVGHRVLLKLQSIWPMFTITAFEKSCTRNDTVLLSRLSQTKIGRVRSNLTQSIKSSIILLFLKKLMVMEIDKNLIQSLDLNSLFRLSLMFGGKTIQVPTYDRVSTLVTSAYYSYLVLVDKVPEDKARDLVVENLGMSVDVDFLSTDLSKLSFLYAKEMENSSSDLYTLFDDLADLISRLKEKLEEKLEVLSNTADFLQMYNDMNMSFLSLTKALQSVSKR